jgi:hypothetical protein
VCRNGGKKITNLSNPIPKGMGFVFNIAGFFHMKMEQKDSLNAFYSP